MASTVNPDTEMQFVAVLQISRIGEEESLLDVSVNIDAIGVEVFLSDGRSERIDWLHWCSGLKADISGPIGEPDCVVDLIDFSVIASQWLMGY